MDVLSEELMYFCVQLMREKITIITMSQQPTKQQNTISTSAAEQQVPQMTTVRAASEEEFEAKWPYVHQTPQSKGQALYPHSTAYNAPAEHWDAQHDEAMNRTATSWDKVAETFGVSFLEQEGVEECIYQNDDTLLIQYAFFANETPVYVLRECLWRNFDWDGKVERDCFLYCENIDVATSVCLPRANGRTRDLTPENA